MWTDEAELLSDVSAGNWLRECLTGFGGDRAGNVIPAAFDAYARVLHPVTAYGEDGSATPHTWASVAERTGRTLHPGAQWHRLIGASDPHETTTAEWPGGDGPDQGNLALEPLLALRDCLLPFTSTPGEAYFGVWEGWGQLSGGTSFVLLSDSEGDPPRALTPPLTRAERAREKLELPGRAYHLLRGPLTALAAVATLEQFHDPSSSHSWTTHQSPSLWWPADRAWCVATEIDFDSTLVGGSAAAIDAILAAPGLEALRIGIEQDLTWDADSINRPAL